MTLIEFLNPIIKRGLSDLCLAALYFQLRYAGQGEITVEELRAILARARVPRARKANLADYLAKSAPYVNVSGKKGNRLLWTITDSGQKNVRTLLGLPESDVEIEHDVSTLQGLATSLKNADVTDYVKEALMCLSVGALRATVVFLWTGAVRVIQEETLAKGLTNVNTSLQRFDNKARTIKTIDDFCYVKESTLLLVAQDVGLYDKNERGILEDALGLRNKCGHPGKYSPGPKKVSSFVEDVINVVFS